MTLEMVLNEQSHGTPARDISTAQQWMAQFIDTIRAAKKLGISTLRVSSEFNTISLAPSYSLAQWRNDRTVDREAQRFLKSLQTKSPFIDSLVDTDLQEQNKLSEFFFEEIPVFGLGIAFLLDSLAISLPSLQKWESSCLKIQHHFLDPDTETIRHNTVDLYHASHPHHLETHRGWIEDRTRYTLWSINDELLPSYTLRDGKTPFAEWLCSLKSPLVKNVIKARLSQVKYGNMGDSKYLKNHNSIMELRFFLGPGYRVYLGNLGASKYLILWGGDKDSQSQDIEKAAQYWKDYKTR